MEPVVNSSLSKDKDYITVDSSGDSLLSSEHLSLSISGNAETSVVDLNKIKQILSSSSLESMSCLAQPARELNCRSSSAGFFEKSVVINLDEGRENRNEAGDNVMNNDNSNQLENKALQCQSRMELDVTSQSEQHSITNMDKLGDADLLCDDSSSTTASGNSQSVESLNSVSDSVLTTDPVSSDKENAGFQPIILDVRGACADSIFDVTADADESCSVQEVDPPSQSPVISNDRIVERNEASPKNALEVLKGIIVNASGISKSQPASHELEIPGADSSSLKTLLNLAKSIASSGAGDLRDNSSLLPSNLINGSQTEKASTVRASASHSNLVNSTTQKTLANNLNFSNFCVVVQNEAKTSKVAAILVPKEDGHSFLVSAKNSKANSNQPQVLPPGELVPSQSKQPVSLATSTMTPAERVKNCIDRTLQNLTITGKDLKKFDMLRLPSNSEWKRLKDCASEFACKVCGESFQEQSGLDGHHVRTVYNLVYECSSCLQALVFINKCQLYLHLWMHQLKTLQYSSIISLMPYDRDKINPPMLLDHSLENVFQGETAGRMCRIYTQVPPVRRMICGVEKDRPKNAVLKCSVCHICLRQTPRPRIEYSYITTCHFCNMHLPSLCALDAHKNLHRSSLANPVCPECGEINFTKGSTFESKKKEVLDHLDQCHHFNRVVELHCLCDESCPDERQLVQHFVDKHTRTMYKCQLCVLAFTLRGQLITHLSSIHKVQNARIISSVLCTYCHVILKKTGELKTHVDEHVRKIKLMAKFKWKCFLCSEICANKEELQHHSSSEHPHKPKRCTICFALFRSRKNLVDHIMEKKCSRSSPICYQQCADLEQSAPSIEVDYGQYFKTEQIVLPKPVAMTMPTLIESPIIQADSGKKLIRIAPKGQESTLLTLNNLSNGQNIQSYPASSQTNTFIVQTDSNNEKVGGKKDESSKTNEQDSAGNIQIKLWNGRPNAKSSNLTTLDHPVIVNKKLTFHKGAAEGPAPGVSGSSPEVISSQFLSQPKGKSDFTLFQCHQCKIVLVGKSRYDHHIEKHLERDDLIGSRDETKCVVCKKQIQNILLTLHLKGHQADGVIVCCRCQRTDFKNMDLAVNHANYFCGYTIMTGIEVNIQKSGTKRGAESMEGKGSAEVCNTNDKNETSLFPCLLCGLAFLSQETRDEHVGRLHDGTRMIFHCLKCKEKEHPKTFSKRESVVKHLVKKHRIVKMTSVEKFIRAEERNASNGQKLPEVNSLTTDSSPSLPPKRLRIAEGGDYMCGKCGFSCSSSTEFSEHIQSHNANKEPQCPECGLCFIVVSALKKHLFAVHRIRKVEEFLKNKEINIPEFDVEEPLDVEIFPLPAHPRVESLSPHVEKRALNPLECTVCYKVFDAEIDLKTHMRNHGMAFIRSKRHKM